ncbi:MAG: gamma-glutamyltransferase [Thermoanaerobaculia bacterium]
MFQAVAAAAASLPAVTGRGGAVASADPLATEAGLAVLRDGGNAADAAVATALVLAVVYPEAGNLGGGGFAVLKFGERLASLDFRETAPAAAHREMYLDEAGEPRPEASLFGGLAAGVPGSPRGLWELHDRFGHLPWRRVVEPARRFAGRGFRVSARLERILEKYRDRLGGFSETSRVWLAGGRPPAAGSTFRLPSLARALKAYARSGPEALTRGRLAEAAERAARRHGGVLTAADLAAYRPVWREPVRFEAFGWRFAAMDQPSSGAVVVGQILGMAERVGWHRQPRFGAARAHLLAEAMRRAFVDRLLLGDPAAAQATAAELLDPIWLDSRAAAIDPRRATASRQVSPRPAEPPPEPADTTHLSVVDGQGNLVALTTTLNGLFGSAVMVPEAGYLLNNEMDDFTTAPGRPNIYGLVQGRANEIAPGKRMLSSMSPTIAWRDGEALAVGGRGGPRILTGTAQVLLSLVADGEELQTALDRPRIHHQWLPDRLWGEPDALSPETAAELKRRGHQLAERPTVGKVHAVRRHADGRVVAAADPRDEGAAGVVSEYD